MKGELSEAMKIMPKRKPMTAPVYTFIRDLKPPMLAKAEAIAAVSASLSFAPPNIPAANTPTIGILMQQAEEAMDNKS